MFRLLNVNKTFNTRRTNEISVLKDVSLSFPNNGLFVILGPSGSGKSTLLSLMGALDTPDSGKIYYNGYNINHFSEKEKNHYRQNLVSFIFQDHNLIDYLSLLDNALLKSEKSERTEEILKKLDIYHLLKKRPETLSGGERERCAITRAVLANSEILLCDEPTASLDSKNAENVISILKEISKDKLVIVVSHDEKLCAKYADSVIYIKDGMIKQEDSYSSEAKTSSNINNKNKVYRSRIFKKAFLHIRHKLKESLFLVALSTIAFFFVSMIIGLASGSRAIVTKAVNELIHHSPLTISSYYENISYIDILNNDEPIYHVGINIMQDTNIVESLHKNIITDELVDYLKEDKEEDTFFTTNNDQSYSIVYEENGSYRLFDSQSNNSLNDYIESFFGKDSFINNLVYNETYFKKEYNWIEGRFPINDNEAVLVYARGHSVTADIAKVLGLKAGDDPSTALNKTIHLCNHDDLYSVIDTKEVTGRFLKDKETLAQEGLDLRAISNYFVQYANDYYDGNVNGQKDAQKKINALFKDEVETKTLKAYTKLQNSTKLGKLIENNKTDDVKIVGIAEIPEKTLFPHNLNGILIPEKKLEAVRERNSQSEIANEIDNHIVLEDSSSTINIPHIYGYLNFVDEHGFDSIEDYILSFIEFFESRKFFSVNNEISSIEIYNSSPKIKDRYVLKIQEYNKLKDEAYELKYLDFSVKITRYFNQYFAILESVLYVISITTLIVSGILSLALLFSMVLSRIKEIAILRSSGYSRGYVFSLFEIEHTILGLISGVLGVVLSYIIAPLVRHYFASTNTDLALDNIVLILPHWSVIIILLSIVVSFLAAFIPSFIYSRKKPIELLKR
ncbi:MAG: ATP-binding cassette domain-containing protein [Bacilli bacterium]|nr:ATP-binding cassette domain-containing protein [Bacilli bacterium]